MILTKRNKEILKLMGLDDPGTLLGMELNSIHAVFHTMDGRIICYIADRAGFAMAVFLMDGNPCHGLGPGTPKAVFMKTLKELDRHKGVKLASWILTTTGGEDLLLVFNEQAGAKEWEKLFSSDYCTKYRLYRLSELRDIFFGATA